MRAGDAAARCRVSAVFCTALCIHSIPLQAHRDVPALQEWVYSGNISLEHISSHGVLVRNVLTFEVYGLHVSLASEQIAGNIDRHDYAAVQVWPHGNRSCVSYLESQVIQPISYVCKGVLKQSGEAVMMCMEVLQDDQQHEACTQILIAYS